MEELTFRQLFDLSDEARKKRAKSMDVRSLKILPEKDGESWTFSYKSNPSTTGKRHQGYIKFLKGELESGKSAYAMNCIVDCTCPDFKYRYAYNDKQKGASVTGNDSWNKNNGATPQYDENKHVGLCKHLISLAEYLKTKLDSKKPLKESSSSASLDALIIECADKTLIFEGKLRDFINKKIAELEILIPKLENEYDKLDDKSLDTYHIKIELHTAQEELRNLKNLEL